MIDPSRSLEHDPDFRRYVAQIALQHGHTPEQLEAVIAQESGWDPLAVSSAGAVGLGQFMPETAERYNVNPLDPRSSVKGMARYLQDLKGMFHGDWQLANAGYNWGEGNVQSWLDTGVGKRGQPIPEQTLTHVKKITGGELPMNGQHYVARPDLAALQQPMTTPIPGAGVEDLFVPASPSIAPQSAPDSISARFMAAAPDIGRHLATIGMARRGVPYNTIQAQRLAVESELSELKNKKWEREQQRKLQEVIEQLPEPIRSAARLDPTIAAKYLAPQAAEGTSMMRNWQFYQRLKQQDPAAADAFWSKVGGGTDVNVNLPGAETFQEEWGKQKAKYVQDQITKFMDERGTSRQNLDSLDRMSGLIEMGLRTGGGTEARRGMTELARELNIPVNLMDPKEEVFYAEAGRMAQEILNRAKGPQTDEDFKRAVRTLPGLEKSPAANEQIIHFLRGRAFLDTYFSQRMNEAQIANTPSESERLYREASRRFREAPASFAVRDNGRVIGFYHAATEIPKLIDQGMSMESAIDHWIKAYQESRPK